ncbi:hypothetical protein MCOR25_011022 [Pyricularia grisea]|nr:hypothetical protein MCOR25_011022 [Pyricularia grisea]
MSVQVGGTNIPRAGAWPPHLDKNSSNNRNPGGPAYSFYREHGLDYLVQQPSSPPAGAASSCSVAKVRSSPAAPQASRRAPDAG